MHARLLPACMLLYASCVHAAESKVSELLSEDAYLGDVPQVLTVSRLAQPVADAPAAVTVIDRETIRASGIVDLPDIFRLVPGFYVATNASFFQTVNPVVSYHGMTDAYSRRMQVMIDGRSVYEPLYGGVQWSDLPLALADIERIEVTRGPNAASYGANSFLGVINIITQHSSQTEGSSVSLVHGNGRNEAYYRYGGKINDLTYRVTTGYRQDDGLQNRNDYKRTKMITVRADYRASNKDELEFQFGYNGGDREEGDDNFDSVVFHPRSKDVYSHFQVLRWRHAISDSSDLTIQAYHSLDQSKDPVVSVDLRFVPDLAALAPFLASPRIRINNDVRNERFDLEVQHTFALMDKARMVWGGSVRQDRTTAPFYLNTTDTDTFNLLRGFAHLELRPLKRLVFNLGAMVEHNDLTGTDVSPRASANFTLAPGHTLRVGISTATRTPTYLEEKFQARIVIPTTIPGVTAISERFRDSGGLDPERIVSREIGYLGSAGGVSIDARLFHDTLSDLIKGTRVPRPYIPPPGFVAITGRPGTYVNDGNADVRGFEAQLQWRLGSTTRLIANYARTKIYGKADELERDFLQSAPTETISALLTQRFGAGWDGSLAYYQVSSVSALGDGDPLGANRHWDARLARRFELTRVRGEIAAAVQNLFDSHYHEFATYNVMGRRAYINLKLDF